MQVLTDQKRKSRIKKSNLIYDKTSTIDRFLIKFADKSIEFEKAFNLLHDTYIQSGYLQKPRNSNMLFSIYHFLPDTAVLIAQSCSDVISTMTCIPDHEYFGLPMDDLYHEELRPLRAEGRKIAEISSLAIQKRYRFDKIFLNMCRIIYWYSKKFQINDLCITVNPKHEIFYRTVFLFDKFGPNKYYQKVNASAVALRLNMDDIEGNLERVYGGYDPDINIHSFFHTPDGMLQDHTLTDNNAGYNRTTFVNTSLKNKMAKRLLREDSSILDDLSSDHLNYLGILYPDIIESTIY